MANKDIHITVKISNADGVKWLPVPKRSGNRENYSDLSGQTAQDGIDQILRSLILSNPLVLDPNATKDDLLRQIILGMKEQAK